MEKKTKKRITSRRQKDSVKIRCGVAKAITEEKRFAVDKPSRRE